MVSVSEIFCLRLTLFVTFLGLRLCLTLFFALDLYWKLRSSGALFEEILFGTAFCFVSFFCPPRVALGIALGSAAGACFFSYLLILFFF